MKLLNRLANMKATSKSQFELGYLPPQELRENFSEAEPRRPKSMKTWEYAKDICTDIFADKPQIQSLMGRVFFFLDPENKQEFDSILQNHLRYFEESVQIPEGGNDPLAPNKISLFMKNWNREHSKPSYPFFYIQRQSSSDLWEMFGAKKASVKFGWSKINYYEHFQNYPSFINKISGDSNGIKLLSFVNIGHGGDTQKYARELAKFVMYFLNEVINDIDVYKFLQKKLSSSRLSSFEHEHDQCMYSFLVNKKRVYVQEPELPHIMFRIRK